MVARCWIKLENDRDKLDMCYDNNDDSLSLMFKVIECLVYALY